MDCLTIGDSTVTFDREGAVIARKRPRTYDRITAATATNAVDALRHHRTLCVAMLKHRPEELAADKLRDHAKGRTDENL